MGYQRGIADSGPEFGGNFPGVFGTDYHYDGLGTCQFFASRGYRWIRLPISWERIQPTRASQGTSTLNAAELARVTTYISNAWSCGLRVVLDIHNYCRYITPGGVTLVLYTDFPESDLIDLWTKLSTALNGNPGILAYELMNEPHDLPTIVGAFTPSQTVADFETTGTTITGWTTNGGEPVSKALSTVQAHSPTHALAFTATSWAASGFDDIRPWDLQNTYTYDGTHKDISAWVWAPTAAGTGLQAYLALITQSGSEDKSGNIPLTGNAWTQLVWTPAVASWTSNQGIRLQISANNAAGGTPIFYVDDIQIGTKAADTLGQQRWQTTSQNLINAIRGNGDKTAIWVNGYSFASAFHWVTNHPTPWLTDTLTPPNLVYIAHHYCGTNENGIFETWTQENTDAIGRGYAGITDQAVQRLQFFTNWCRTNNVAGGVTEIAVRGDEEVASWQGTLDAMYRELDNAGMPVCYWGNGEWWPALAGSNPAWYGGYTNGTGGGSSPVSVANPQAAVVEAHPSSLPVLELTLAKKHRAHRHHLGDAGGAQQNGSTSLYTI